MQVFVIGDVMLDIYQSGIISRISPEAPVPVVLNAQETFAAGGAANVAVNLASIGLPTRIAGIIGKDSNGEKLSQIIKNAGITTQLFQSESQPTISKCRVLGNEHHLARIDTEGNFSNEASTLFEAVKNQMAPWIILSDYNKGSLQNIPEYIHHFQSKGAKVIADPKREISAYQGAWLIKPNKNEFLKYIGNFSNHEELIEKAKKTLQKNQIQQMLITLGSEGMMYVNLEHHQYYPSQTIQVADITGAGDTVLAGLVYGLANGKDIYESILISKKLAEYAVTKIGTYVLTSKDILDIL